MIKIEFTEPDNATWKEWKRDCEKTAKAVIESIERGENCKIPDLFRRGTIKKTVFFSKNGPFHGKCAYCECYITDFQPGSIEHFRPKKNVTDENDIPIMIEDEHGNQKNHPGYYWVAYDWKNLLPSCFACNHTKANKFPVKGKHATKAEEIGNEQPLLLHPVVDNPDDHLSIDFDTGTLVPLTDRGEMSIKVFALNRRDRLPEERKRTITEVKAAMLLAKISKSTDALKNLEELITCFEKGERAYSIAGRAILKSEHNNFV